MPSYPRRKRRNSKMVFMRVDLSLALGTLTNGTVAVAEFDTQQMDRTFWAVGCKFYWALRDLTPGEGPLEVGVSHNDLTVGEIAQALDAEVRSRSDIIEREQASRPVRRSGQFSGLVEAEVLNNGLPIKTRMQYEVNNDFQGTIWARNKSGATLTTGAILNVAGIWYGKWR